MALRTVPIRQVGNRANQVLGGDRELVLTSAILCGALVFSAADFKAAVVGGLLWVAILFLLRKMAKSDPLMRQVYLRSLKYSDYYPAQSTPFVENKREYK
jgi:type IV secretion system protein VirB3